MAEFTAEAMSSLSATAQTAADQAATAAEAAQAASDNAADASKSAKEAVDLLKGIKVVLDPSTSTFHLWQQILAWVLAGAAIVLALIGALRDSVATELWYVIGGFTLAAIVASFRSKTEITVNGDDGEEDEDAAGNGGADPAKPGD